MSTIRAVDLANAAADVVEGLEAGTLRPADTERRAVAAMREQFGIVGSGPADPLWSLHGDVARQYLAAGGLTAAELGEWLSVQRRREQPADADTEPDHQVPGDQ